MNIRSDITVYLKRYNEQLRDDEWHCFHLYNALWFNGQRTSLTTSKYNKTVLRIFERELLNTYALKGEAYSLLLNNKGELFIKEGDVILLGIYEDTLPSIAKEKAEQSFTVQTVTNNKKGSAAIRHYRIGGV